MFIYPRRYFYTHRYMKVNRLKKYIHLDYCCKLESGEKPLEVLNFRPQG